MKANVRNLLAALVVATALGPPAVAGSLDDGIAAYHEKEYAKAAELWQPLAEKGDPAAQYLLGTLYMAGKGVKQNDATAFMWFQRAANQGNDVDAAKWFQRAANQGMVFAQLNLGLLYAAGNGVPQDNVEAFKWLELAFFALPTGGPRSDVARAMTDVAAKMTREQIDDAKRRERGWKAQPEVK